VEGGGGGGGWEVGETITEREKDRGDGQKNERREGRMGEKEKRDNGVEQVGKTLKRAANAFIATLDFTLA